MVMNDEENCHFTWANNYRTCFSEHFLM